MKPERCPVCGAPVPLFKTHVIPYRLPTGRYPANMVYMCANCQTQMGQGTMRGFEFEGVLADLMRRSGLYERVMFEPELSGTGDTRLHPDLLAIRKDGHKILIECKGAPTVSERRLVDALEQLKRYQGIVQANELVLAIPARLTPAQRMIVRDSGVQTWDLDEIAARFQKQLHDLEHPVLRPLLLAVSALNGVAAPRSPEDALLTELKNLGPGRTSWSAYQKLIGRIAERLFCPPLSPPILELTDESGANRRDIILPNYAENGFWAFVRARYAADFLVIDAKNHAEPVGKDEALQILNYLKEYGAGLLGMIVSRKGGDRSCFSTIREKWATYGKLVIVVSDEHVERMLRAKESGGPPEDVLRQWIEDFRLSC